MFLFGFFASVFSADSMSLEHPETLETVDLTDRLRFVLDGSGYAGRLLDPQKWKHVSDARAVLRCRPSDPSADDDIVAINVQTERLTREMTDLLSQFSDPEAQEKKELEFRYRCLTTF